MEAALLALEEGELMALQSIFSPSDLLIHRPEEATSVHVLVYGNPCTASLHVDPLTYPAQPPLCEVEGLRRGEAAAVLEAVAKLGSSLAGSAMLYELINLLRELLGVPGAAGPAEAQEEPEEQAQEPPYQPVSGAGVGGASANSLSIFSGACETERKSVFQGHAAAVSSVEQVAAALEHIASLPRVARATHPCMYAYRIVTPEGATLADNCDDGESGAGAKLAQLLVNMQANSGALVVVSRWYGGVPLGPSRFGIIANVARKALLQAGLGERGK